MQIGFFGGGSGSEKVSESSSSAGWRMTRSTGSCKWIIKSLLFSSLIKLSLWSILRIIIDIT